MIDVPLDHCERLAQVYGFYDMPRAPVGEPAWYHDYYDWTERTTGETPIKPLFWAKSLKWEIFDTVEKKAYFVKGHIEESAKDSIHFANSLERVEKVIEFIGDVCYTRKEIGLTFPIVNLTRLYTCPICSIIKLKPETVEFFRNFC